MSDRLRIFVSSTIHECASERTTAKTAVLSLNHTPTLFEDVGSRPHPPRTVYQRLIEEAHIFLAIYRHSYGWVAPDSDISGIEDEYRLATARGIPRHIYVWVDATDRQPRLDTLITQIKHSGHVTIAGYRDLEELRLRIRDDLTATISEKFLAAGPISLFLPQHPRDLLNGLVPNPAHRVLRPSIETAITDRLNTNFAIVLRGPLGSGKTVLAGMLASENNWLFVNGYGKSLKEVFGSAANLLRHAKDAAPLGFNDASEARQAFVEAWKASHNVTLAVDGFDAPDQVFSAVMDGGGISVRRRILLTSRDEPITSRPYLYELPPFSADEVRDFVAPRRGSTVASSELHELRHRSQGNPLYLRYYMLGNAGTFENELRSYELREWAALPPRTREAVSYLTLAGRSLSLADLATLLAGPGYAIEEVAAVLSPAAHILRADGSFFDLFHEHLRDTILDLILSSPGKHTFLAGRLGRHLDQSGDSVTAFIVLERAEDPYAVSVVGRAAFEAIVRGDVTRAIHIVERQIEFANQRSSAQDEIEALLTVAGLYQQSGDAQRALSAATNAERRAASLSPGLASLARERRLSLDLVATGSRAALNELVDMHKNYRLSGDLFAAGRSAVEISAALIRASNYEEAATYARDAVDLLSRMGDQYGGEIARANLGIALSMLGKPQEAAAPLLAELTAASAETSPRKRALMCNLLTRRYREEGNLELAEASALEAISLGERLGDRYVVALNQINLGNVYRQGRRLDEALTQYNTASRIAAAASFRDIDAHANDLIANVLNRKRDYTRALHHSEYAIALARETSNQRRLSSAFQEKGRALEQLSRPRDAGAAYLDGARAVKDLADAEETFVDLLRRGVFTYAEDGDLAALNEGLESLFFDDDQDTVNRRGPTAYDSLFNHLPTLVTLLPPQTVVPITGAILRAALGKIPAILVTHAVRKLVSTLLKVDPRFVRHILLALGTLLAALPVASLRIEDVVQIAEKVARFAPGLSFKPHQDGAAYWTVTLDLGRPIVFTVSQLDDRVDVFLASMITVVWLLAVDDLVSHEIVLSQKVQRKEANALFINVDELTRVFGEDVGRIGLTLPMQTECVVSRTTDPTRGDQPPILMILRGDVGAGWMPGKGKASSLQFVTGLLLTELVFHLMGGEVDEETLRPKIIAIVARTIS